MEKHFVPHQEIEELEESEEHDQIMIEDVSYAQLRGMQNTHISRSFNKLAQKEATLIQQDLDIDSQNEIGVDASISADSTQGVSAKVHEK